MASPLDIASSNIVSFTVLSDGTPINDTITVLSLSITQEANAVDEALLTILDGSKEGGFTVADASTFTIGMAIEIRLGYAAEQQRVFKGLVAAQHISVDPELGTSLQVSCKGTVLRHVESDGASTVLDLTYGYDVYAAALETHTLENTSVSGNLKFQGSAKVAVNDRIGLSGFGTRFSKTSVVTGLKHSVAHGEWFTEVRVR